MTASPIIDGRDRSAILAALIARRLGYVPEWRVRDGTPAYALLSILARDLEIQMAAQNGMPDRARLAFLSMLGNSLLSAQSARTPLIFRLMDNAPLDVTLTGGSEVAAKLPPPPPSLLAASQAPATQPLFTTEEMITLTRTPIAALYSVDPTADSYADHGGALTTGFTLFDAMQPVPHQIYLGHDALFALPGQAQIELSVTLAAAAAASVARPLLLDWEYLSADGWLPLLVVEDQTARLTRDGKIKLAVVCGPPAKQDKVNGIESYWIRATVSARVPSGVILRDGDRTNRVTLDTTTDFLVGDIVTVDGNTHATITKIEATSVTLDKALTNVLEGSQLTLANALPVLRPEGADNAGVLPRLEMLRARVGFTSSDVAADAAACDTTPLDISNNFYPFGKQPEKYTTFYLANKDVFQRQNAQVAISVYLAQVGKTFDDHGNASPAHSNAMRWTIEYFNGSWVALDISQSLDDETDTMTAGDQVNPKTISFVCPDDWGETTVNGQSNYWLRIRIDAGNYGHPLRLSVDTDHHGTPHVKSDPETLQPPIVASLRLGYTHETSSQLLDHCVTYNDFAFADHIDDVRWRRRSFEPFTPVNDSEPAVHFGFARQLPVGLVSLYFAADAAGNNATDGNGAAAPSSPFVWEYFSAAGWVGLSVLDATDGFTGSGLIQFIGPPDSVARAGLGGTCYWVRARLKPGLQATALPGTGLWLNAVWAHQGESVQNDTLGISNGNPGQTFIFAPQHVPVLEGEIVKVREWSGRGDDWQTAVAGVPPSDLSFDIDPSDSKTVIGVWVTWQGRPHFYLSGPNDRHYVLERATGTLQFPTPPYGMIPTGGAVITASYDTGGGLAGNVPAGTITEMHSGASYVQSVTNPFPATGGSATEDAARARDRATQRLRHRDRAVAPADFEWLACEASPEVARARCLPITGPDGTGERGWVTLVVVPNSTDPAPTPTAGLLAEVRAELQARVPAAIVSNTVLTPPSYTPVSVRADIVPRHADEAAFVEARVRDGLAAFLHPLTGGAAGTGWDFGQSVYLSQVASLVEQTEGVDFVPLLQLLVDDSVVGDRVPMDPGALVTAGDHQLKIAGRGAVK
jgi:hypothetical protein